MGGQSSKEESPRSNPPPWNYGGYPSTSYSADNYQYGQHPQQDSSPHYDSLRDLDVNRRTIERKYSRIADDYHSLDQVTEALSRAGLESSNLIIGIDFTKSNEWTGVRSYNRRCLHHLGDTLNPYEQAISIVGRTLSAFDEDNMIPCYGFGDATTHNNDVFSFIEDDEFCAGFEHVLSRYRDLMPHIRLSGPTSFAPIIEMATTIVEQSGGQYHVLVIIADGQVTRSVDTEPGKLSKQEQQTIHAIVEASKFPLSIVLVGVGDGPWDTMKEFDDNIPARDFDNFQFVNFTEIMSKKVDVSRKETQFALAALMEIPAQYKATIELNLLGRVTGSSPRRLPLPPPTKNAKKASVSSTSFTHRAPVYSPAPAPAPAATYLESSGTANYDNQICPICLSNPKDMAFGCGHQTCCDCGEHLNSCPICRRPISTRIKLF